MTLIAVDGLAYGLLLFLAASGLTLVLGTARIVHLGHGAVFAAGTYLAAALGDGSTTAFAVSLAAATAVGAGGGAAFAALTAAVARGGELAQALLTGGLGGAGAWTLNQVFGATPLSAPAPAVAGSTVEIGGDPYPAYRLVVIAVATVVAGAGWIALRRTRAGMLVRAAVDDPSMAALTSGVSPGRVHATVMVAGGALAGFAGAAAAPVLGAGPDTAGHTTMLCLAIVILGGPGSVPGALAAALMTGQLLTLGVLLMPQASGYLLYAAVVVVLLLRAVAPRRLIINVSRRSRA